LSILLRVVVRILVIALIVFAVADEAAAQSPRQRPGTDGQASYVHNTGRAELTRIRVRLVVPTTGQTLSSAAAHGGHFPAELIRQTRGERSPMLFPVIGLLAGGVAGYFYGRDTPPDAYVSRLIWTIPIGAAAGFVLGIMVDDVASKID
jgi:hypothetical protein